ncbi:hypothetical protein D1872_202300 [compost metagenome]
MSSIVRHFRQIHYGSVDSHRINSLYRERFIRTSIDISFENSVSDVTAAGRIGLIYLMLFNHMARAVQDIRPDFYGFRDFARSRPLFLDTLVVHDRLTVEFHSIVFHFHVWCSLLGHRLQ